MHAVGIISFNEGRTYYSDSNLLYSGGRFRFHSFGR